MLQHHRRRLVSFLSTLVVAAIAPTVAKGQFALPEIRGELGQEFGVVEFDEKARKALQRQLVGTKWRIAKNGLTILLEKKSYHVSDWGKRRGIWMVTGYNRIGGVAYEGSHNDMVFEPSLKSGNLIVDGKPYSKITLVQAIKPLDQKLPQSET